MDFLLNRTATIAEQIDLMIEYFKKNNMQNGICYNQSKRSVVIIFDNSNDPNKENGNYEDFEQICNILDGQMRRIQDANHDWWVSILPVSNEEAVDYMARWH